MDGVGSFAASASVMEDLPQPVEGNMQNYGGFTTAC